MAKRMKKGNRKPAADLLYGRQAVREALRAKRRQVQVLYVAKGIKPNNMLDEIITLTRHLDKPVESVDRGQLDEWLAHANHQSVALRSGGYPYAQLDDTLALARSKNQDPLLLLLDRVQDPQNLGTLMRTAEAFAVHGIVLPRHRAAHISPAVVNTSAGAVEHLLICQESNLVKTLQWLKAQGVWIAGLEANHTAQPIDATDMKGPLGIVVGSEGFGLSRLVAETCDWLVSLPMTGQINSLNAAVAGSICLFVAMSQRGVQKK